MNHIEEFPGYAVSPDGTVYSLNYRGKADNVQPIRTTWITGGYRSVSMQKNKKQYNRLVHRLVAQAFIQNPEGKKEVNHKDGDKENNSVENLEWMTPQENIKHARETGLRVVTEKEREAWRKINREKIDTRNMHARKLSDDRVIEVRERYKAGGISYRGLCKEFGLAFSTVQGILNGKLYREVRYQ